MHVFYSLAYTLGLCCLKIFNMQQLLSGINRNNIITILLYIQGGNQKGQHERRSERELAEFTLANSSNTAKDS